MKKIFCIPIIAVLLWPQIANAFIDVPQTNKYYNAINFLQENNIIKGYSDDTFRPENPVIRAEFLKMIILSAGLKLDVFGNTGFKDVPENEWYTPYVRKAHALNIISGYEDNTFRPAQSITKAEALKIIGETQNWSLPKTTSAPFEDVPGLVWYAKYISFAKTHNLIDSGKFFYPDESITRGLTADILYKSSKNGVSKITKVSNEISAVKDVFRPLVSPEIPSAAQDQQIAGFSMVNGNFFDNITLNSDFPTNFYKNEIYKFEGSINSGSTDSIFIFLAYKDSGGNDKTLEFIGPVNSDKFSVPVIFRYTGTYNIGIIPGTKGVSKIKSVSVLDSLPAPSSTSPTQAPEGLNISFSNNKTTAAYTPAQSSIARISFAQGEQIVSYISRQQINALDIPYEDFYKFSPGSVDLIIENAGVLSFFPLKISSEWSSQKISFSATRHLFNKIENNKISVSGLSAITNAPKQINLSGVTNTEVSIEAYVIKPDGLVDRVEIKSAIAPVIINEISVLPKGSSYSFSYTPAQTGTYVIGISESTGASIVNTPVYIGNSIPLFPDFFDLKISAPQDGENLQGASDKFLKWINGARQNLGINSVQLDAMLTILAQKHSEDMAKNNYFSHVNLQGQTPNDRRIALNIPTEVGENIAKTASLIHGFEGFMRSPSHRKNILDAEWVKVGFGFKKDAQNNILITQEFSPNPLISEDITRMENELFSRINSERQKNSLAFVIRDNNLSIIAKSWSEKMAEQRFTDLTSSDGSTLEKIIKNNVSSSFVKMFVYSQNTSGFFKENAVEQSGASSENFSKIGIGMAVTSLGELKATIILTL